MPLIKLDAIDSTNDYLKQLAKERNVENYTIVLANEQTKGKGQMGAQWVSEIGKNLTMSVLVKNLSLKMISIFDFNIAVAMAMVNTLEFNSVPNVKLKWPNDIMADSKKVGGLLIENIFMSNDGFTAVVGLGLNLNQTNFEHLPQASSLTCIMNTTFDIEKVALTFVEMVQKQLDLLPQNKNNLWEEYNKLLFKKGTPVVFEAKSGKRFMGIIQNVNQTGKLEVLLEDDSISQFEVKEIKMLY